MGDGRLDLTRDHHLGGLDDRERIVAPAQLQFFDRVSSDDGGQRLVADSQPYLAEQAIDTNLLHETMEAVASAERHDDTGGRLHPRAGGRRGTVPREKPLDLRLGDPMMAAGGLRGSDAALVDPLLQRRVADTKAICCRPNRQKPHRFVSMTSTRMISNRTSHEAT